MSIIDESPIVDESPIIDELSIIDGSPRFVTITNVHRRANMLAGDVTWPIIQSQNILTPASFWNITRVAGSNNQYLLQDNARNRFLIPGGERNTCLLSNQVFAWRIEPAGGSNVNLYRISNPANGNVLQAGFRFANPPNAYAVVAQGAGPDPSTAMWLIDRPHN